MSEKKLGFGLMRLPEPAGRPGQVDIDTTKRMVDIFLDRGFTYFDTALMYCGGNSEAAVKEVLVKCHPRESFTVTTKLHAEFFKDKNDIDKVFKGQLEKTGAGYFDYYWLHDMNSHSFEKFEQNDCFDWIQGLKKSGAVKHIGFSFHDSADFLDRILTEHPEFEYVQLQINYLDWESNAIQSRLCYEVATKHNKPVIVMEPVKGGTLANVPAEAMDMFRARDLEASAASWAIRFAASLPNVWKVLSGMSTIEQVEDNTSYMQDFVPLTEDERRMCLKAADIINGNIEIPCTGCEYCIGGCPMNIPIPKIFSLYNADKQEAEGKGWTPQGGYYDNLVKNTGKASDCIACRQCEGVCPQHLSVVDNLRKIAGYFGK